MMKSYICKYCEKAIPKRDTLNDRVYLIDHLLMCHKDKLEEFGGIYLNDIPKECYILKESAGENKKKQPVVHPDISEG